MKRLAIGLASLIVILVVGALILYSSLGSIITKAVTTAGPEIVQARVELRETVIDASSGKGTMRGLLIGNPKDFETESAFKMEEVKLILDTDSVTSDTVIIKEISILAPDITYELGGNGSNIDAIQKNVDAFVKKYGGSSDSGDKGAAKANGTKLVIDHVYIKGGKVNVSATFLGGKSITVSLPDLHLKDIGKAKNGATPGEVVKSILDALRGAILKAVAPLNLDKVGEAAGKVVEGAKDVAQGTVKGVEDTLQKGAEGVTDAVKGIFGD